MSRVSFYERRLRSTHTECKMLTVLWPEESGTPAWHRRGSGRPRAGRQPCPQHLQSRSGPGGTPGRPLCPGTGGVRVPRITQKVSSVMSAKSGLASTQHPAVPPSGPPWTHQPPARLAGSGPLLLQDGADCPSSPPALTPGGASLNLCQRTCRTTRNPRR